MTYIRHVTLNTGHIRDSHPGEISPETITVCQRLIAAITSGEIAESIPIPGVGPYSLAGRASARCLTATVWADGPPSVIVATIGVATHSRCGASLWRELHNWGDTPVVTDPDACPPEPWVAAALDPGIIDHPDAAEWLGDFERSLAWAWMSYATKK